MYSFPYYLSSIYLIHLSSIQHHPWQAEHSRHKTALCPFPLIFGQNRGED
jgi:hypothetical protein